MLYSKFISIVQFGFHRRPRQNIVLWFANTVLIEAIAGAGKKSHLTRFAEYYTCSWYLVGNSYRNAGCWYSSQRYTPTDRKVVNVHSYTFINIYIMAHLLCAEEHWFIWVRVMVMVMECRTPLKSNDWQNCVQMCWTLNWKLTTFLVPPFSSVGV